MGATMVVPVSKEIGVTAPTTTTTMTQTEIGTFVPLFAAGVPVSTSIHASPNPQVRARFDDRFLTMHNLSREQQYGMPTSMMKNLHNNASVFTYHANPFTPFNTHSPSTLTTESTMLFRQQMDESNHEMINLLTQQIGTVFNPLIQSKNISYQALATQMGRVSYFFAPLQHV